MSGLAITVAELAACVGGRVVGDGGRKIASCAGLEEAGPDDVSFLANSKYGKLLETTRAGCVIVDDQVAHQMTRHDLTLLTSANPYFSFREAVVRLHGFREQPAHGISPLASIHPTARLGKNVSVQAFATLGAGVTIGDNAQIYPHVAVMAGAAIGRDCILYPNAIVYDGCVLGDRVILQAGAVVGSDGYGFATQGGVHHKIPQIGRVVVENDVEIGANSVIERAVLDATVIGQGTKIGNGVVVGHNCRIGKHNLLVSQVGIAGSTTTGDYVVLAGQVGVAGHLTIADRTRAAAQTGIAQDVTEPGLDLGGTPAMELSQARRVLLQLARLPELAKRVRELEGELRRFTGNGKASGNGNGTNGKAR